MAFVQESCQVGGKEITIETGKWAKVAQTANIKVE